MLTSKPISKDALEDLLSHCVDAGSLSDYYKPRTSFAKGFYWGSDDFSNNENHQGRTFERFWRLVDGLVQIKPKMITNFLNLWDFNDWQQRVQRQRKAVQVIKALLPEVVLTAAPCEYIDVGVVESVNNYIGTIPSWVTDAFGLPQRTDGFRIEDIRFPDYLTNSRHQHDNSPDKFVPDIHRNETKLWFYYMGRTYIDMGCESLTFCQVDLMNGSPANPQPGDPAPEWYSDYTNPEHWDAVISKLRAYADQKNSIRFLLICAGTLKYDNGQFITDYNHPPMRVLEATPGYETDLNGGGGLLKAGICGSYFNTAPGGITPSGWWCMHLPQIFTLDIFNIFPDAGKSSWNGDVYSPPCFTPYNFDELSWFATRPETYRNAWLIYAYNKVKCLDPNGFFTLPYSKPMNIRPYGPPLWGSQYYALAPDNSSPVPLFPAVPTLQPDNVPDRFNVNIAAGYNQIETIRKIINGDYLPPFGWVLNNFSRDEVYKTDPDPGQNARSHLIFVGNEQMYYIADDGSIRGYIKNNGAPGVWRPVNVSERATDPSLAYPIPLNMQPKAKKNLVASPDGKKLLYIGEDNLIHGYDIIDVWNYRFRHFQNQFMNSNEIIADRNLVYAENDRIYFIAEFTNPGTSQIFGSQIVGFILTDPQNNTWEFVWPASIAHTNSQQNINSQAQPGGSLTYAGDRLYFRDKQGYLRFYNIYNSFNYWYNNVSAANAVLIAYDIIITGDIHIRNGKLYFIAWEHFAQKHRIYILRETGAWSLVNVAWQAHLYGGGAPVDAALQVQPEREIAVSDDGYKIAYIGKDGNTYYYQDTITYPLQNNFSYNKLPVSYARISNSLQYRDNGKLYGIYARDTFSNSNEYNRWVYYYQWERDYCKSPYIALVEGELNKVRRIKWTGQVKTDTLSSGTKHKKIIKGAETGL